MITHCEMCDKELPKVGYVGIGFYAGSREYIVCSQECYNNFEEERRQDAKALEELLEKEN